MGDKEVTGAGDAAEQRSAAQERMGVLEVYGVGLAADDPNNKLINKATSEDLFGGGHLRGIGSYSDNKTLAFLPDFSKEELEAYEEEQKAVEEEQAAVEEEQKAVEEEQAAVEEEQEAVEEQQKADGKKKSSFRIEQVITELIAKAEFPFLHGNPDLYIAGGPLPVKAAQKIAMETCRNVFFGLEAKGAKVQFDVEGGMFFTAADGIAFADAKEHLLSRIGPSIYFPVNSKMNAIIDSLESEQSEEEIDQDRQFLDAVEIMSDSPQLMESLRQEGMYDTVDTASGQKDALVFLEQPFESRKDQIKAVVDKLGLKKYNNNGRKAVLVMPEMNEHTAGVFTSFTGNTIVYAPDTEIQVNKSSKGSITLTTKNAKSTFWMVDSTTGEHTQLPRQIRVHPSRAKALQQAFGTPGIQEIFRDPSMEVPPMLPPLGRKKVLPGVN